jgi:hypothetical protein
MAAQQHYSDTPSLRLHGFEDSLSAVADYSGRDPLRVGLASEAALHEIAAWRRRKDDDEYENEPVGALKNHIEFG